MAPPEAADSINEFTVKDRLASILKDLTLSNRFSRAWKR